MICMTVSKKIYIISYDIRAKDRTRYSKKDRKILELLRRYGVDVQFSVFACYLSKRQLDKVLKELEKILDEDDNLFITSVEDKVLNKVKANLRKVENYFKNKFSGIIA